MFPRPAARSARTRGIGLPGSRGRPPPSGSSRARRRAKPRRARGAGRQYPALRPGASRAAGLRQRLQQLGAHQTTMPVMAAGHVPGNCMSRASRRSGNSNWWRHWNARSDASCVRSCASSMLNRHSRRKKALRPLRYGPNRIRLLQGLRVSQCDTPPFSTRASVRAGSRLGGSWRLSISSASSLK